MLAPVLAEPKLDAVLSDRAATAKSELRLASQLLTSSPVAWYASQKWLDATRNDFPHSFATVPLLLPTQHSAVRQRIDHWLERERIRPLIVGEFEDSALLMTFGAAGMGVFPAPVSIRDDLLETHKLVQIGSCSEVQEEFHLIYTSRKVLHPLLSRLLPSSELCA